MQEVEFVEKGEGDVLSRLSVDTSIVGERFVRLMCMVDLVLSFLEKYHAESFRWAACYRRVHGWM